MNHISDLPSLRAFLEVARCNSFTRAASELHISQPALSRRINVLEESLGAVLFSRYMNGVQLTEAGMALFPFAVTAMTALQDGVEAVRANGQGESGNVTIAVTSSLLNPGVISILARFQQLVPKVELSIHSGTSPDVSRLVLSGEAGLGLRYHTDPDPRLHCEPVGTEKTIIGAAGIHPLAGVKAVPRAKLASETWIAVPIQPGDANGGFANVLQQHGLTSRRAMLIDSTMAQKRLIEANFGIGILAYGSVKEELAAGKLVALDVSRFNTTVPIMILHRKNMHIGEATRRLITMLSHAFVTDGQSKKLPRSR